MFKTKLIEDFIALSLYSVYVKNADSVSVLIIAKPESGKTSILKKFSDNKGILWLSDASYIGLLDAVTSNKDIKTLVVPDMLKLIAKSKVAKMSLFTFLNELIEEGIKEVHSYKSKVKLDSFLRCNLIGATTGIDFFETRGLMERDGFLSRLIPFSYSYSKEDVQRIKDMISKGEVFKEEKIKLKLPSVPKKIEQNFDVNERIKDLSEELASGYGFRLQRNLQTLCMASALMRGDKEVKMEDFELIYKMSRYFNYQFREIE